jgi:flagellar basal body-associated protein FliL
VIPWIIVAVIVVPLLIAAFVVMRRTSAATEISSVDDEAARARTDAEFASAEAFEAEWHEEDKRRYQQERLP